MSRTLLAALLLASSPAVVHAQGVPPTTLIDKALVLEGDGAPGTGAGTFSSFGLPHANEDDEVVYTATVVGGTASSGLFRTDFGGVTTRVVLAGEAAPGTGGGTFLGVNGADIGDSGEIVFTASLSGGTAFSGLFRWAAGTISAVALEGDPAPGTCGGTFGGFFDPPTINASGEVGFAVSVFGSPVFSGVFRDDGASIEAVSLTGEVPFGATGQDYEFFGPPVIRPGGSLVFYGELDASLVNGLFVASAPPLGDSTIALAGDPAPVGSGTYSLFFFEPPGVNASGDVAFNAVLDGVPGFDGLFVRDELGTSLAVRNGDPVPDAGGGTFGFFPDNPQMPLNFADPLLLFRASLDGGSASSGIFNDLGGPSALVLEGGAAPDTGGGTFASFDWRPTYGQSEPSHVVYQASVAGGTASSGIFFLPEPSGALGPAFAWLLALAGRRIRSGGA